ncbi:MAG: CO dehydrogenase/CO-methylating acetyl-CoA synthase complex subunit beta [Candidatus Methylarchaceae archaeon HK01B]|nr:CO dehydrogenase/CO-methylating acetyl-CoA synthase complex subunit beta [Candidatus Methylarchaceae archaeon HK01M]MCP8311508.1 CO dehydrogenase/CO-methylating acetyl-CoA synthase complex subunit beta [Candidatus Methylarchaceae archaeon HK02M1]MCP8318249.1 CO dehydrogenase/CO-methylating acetyl-CoA synthase complex subunit beta [Candidatus Methylarchaceae archaeon HK01B]
MSGSSKVDEIKTEPMGLVRPESPVDVGEIYEGERIRKPDMYLEFGGMKVERKWELALSKPEDQIEDGKVTVIGPDLSDLDPGGSYPIGILLEVAGAKVEKDLEGVLERKIHYFLNYIEGVMHLNQRYDIWIRINKKSYQKGLNSLVYIGKILGWLFKSSFPVIEKVQVTIYTDKAKIEELFPMAMDVWDKRDTRARTLKDEDVDDFYACVMCQSFAPTHVCVITPNRMASCGSISWFDARAAYNVDPKGPNFPIPKGECLDPVKGIYEGINKVAQEKSLGGIESVSLYSMFDHPHTSCGCFEAIAFYIPEVDGVGIVHRDFRGPSVNGITFSTMAGHTGGGTQNPGFNGISVEYLRSPKFLQAEGGWERVVWMPSSIKERLKDSIPENLSEKLCTEAECKTIEELKEFLKSKNHPVVSRWKTKEVAEEEIKEEALEVAPPVSAPMNIEIPTQGGFRIILKNARIVAEKVIIKREKK